MAHDPLGDAVRFLGAGVQNRAPWSLAPPNRLGYAGRPCLIPSIPLSMNPRRAFGLARA